MLKLLKKINWEKVVETSLLIVAIAVGVLLFTFAFIFGKAIVEAVF